MSKVVRRCVAREGQTCSLSQEENDAVINLNLYATLWTPLDFPPPVFVEDIFRMLSVSHVQTNIRIGSFNEGESRCGETKAT